MLYNLQFVCLEGRSVLTISEFHDNLPHPYELARSKFNVYLNVLNVLRVVEYDMSFIYWRKRLVVLGTAREIKRERGKGGGWKSANFPQASPSKSLGMYIFSIVSQTWQEFRKLTNLKIEVQLKA